MNIELTQKQYRRLLDLVYIGNWVLNSIRGGDRFEDYDELESLIFSMGKRFGIKGLATISGGEVLPSKAYVEGGIHEAIMDYEDTVFFEILAEELARRDMEQESLDQDDLEELSSRIDTYISEFERNGTDNLSIDL